MVPMRAKKEWKLPMNLSIRPAPSPVSSPPQRGRGNTEVAQPHWNAISSSPKRGRGNSNALVREGRSPLPTGGEAGGGGTFDCIVPTETAPTRLHRESQGFGQWLASRFQAFLVLTHFPDEIALRKSKPP